MGTSKRRTTLRVLARRVDSVPLVADDGFRIELLDGENSARVTGELDLATYDTAMARLAWLFESSGDVVLDLSNLTFVDSSGIRLFILLHQSLGGRGRLVLRTPTPHVAGIMEIAGLEGLGVRLERDPG
jgi:anti-sigma B factor antagonist